MEKMRRGLNGSILTTAAAFMCVPAAAKETSLPHRPWGKTAVLDMALTDAQACIAREMSKTGTVLVLPTAGGSDIDWTIKSFSLGPKGDPFMTFNLREAAGTVTLTGKYRRPMSLRNLEGAVTGLGKRCLTIARIDVDPEVIG